jgi:hypothetical protein
LYWRRDQARHLRQLDSVRHDGRARPIGGVVAVIFGTSGPRLSAPKYFATSAFTSAVSKSPTMARLALFGA